MKKCAECEKLKAKIEELKAEIRELKVTIEDSESDAYSSNPLDY